MMFSTLSCLSLGIVPLLLPTIRAQNFVGEDGQFGKIYPDLSDTCLEALNITLTGCANNLLRSVVDVLPRLESDQLVSLCTSACYNSLQSVREIILSKCVAATDVIKMDAVVWPGALPSTIDGLKI